MQALISMIHFLYKGTSRNAKVKLWIDNAIKKYKRVAENGNKLYIAELSRKKLMDIEKVQWPCAPFVNGH